MVLVLAVAERSNLLYGSLVENSPFLPQGFDAGRLDKSTKPKSAAEISREIEFRGLLQVGDAPEFCLFDKKSQKGQWVSLNDPAAQYQVLSFDPESESIRVQSGDEVQELTISKPASIPAVAARRRPRRVPLEGLPTVGAPPTMRPPTPPPRRPPTTRPPSGPPPELPPGYRSIREDRRRGLERSSGSLSVRRKSSGRSSRSTSSSRGSSGRPSSTPIGDLPDIGPPPSMIPGPPPDFTPPPLPNQANPRR